MQTILTEIQDGTFAKEWIAETKAGQKNYKRLLEEDLKHPVEEVGKKLRANMSWLQKSTPKKEYKQLAASGKANK